MAAISIGCSFCKFLSDFVNIAVGLLFATFLAVIISSSPSSLPFFPRLPSSTSLFVSFLCLFSLSYSLSFPCHPLLLSLNTVSFTVCSFLLRSTPFSYAHLLHFTRWLCLFFFFSLFLFFLPSTSFSYALPLLPPSHFLSPSFSSLPFFSHFLPFNLSLPLFPSSSPLPILSLPFLPTTRVTSLSSLLYFLPLHLSHYPSPFQSLSSRPLLFFPFLLPE